MEKVLFTLAMFIPHLLWHFVAYVCLVMLQLLQPIKDAHDVWKFLATLHAACQ